MMSDSAGGPGKSSNARTSAGQPFPRWRDPDSVFSAARPFDIVDSFLIDGEHVVYQDKPDQRFAFVDHFFELSGAIVCALGAFLVPSLTVAFALAVLAGVLVFVVALKIFRRSYTQYLLTNVRVMRVEGLLRRETSWVSWGKITDVTVHQTLGSRLMGNATIRIHSAGAEALKDLDDLHNWRRFVDEIVTYTREFR